MFRHYWYNLIIPIIEINSNFMRHCALLLIFLSLTLGQQAIGQSDSTTVYKELQTIKFYAVNLDSFGRFYKANGRIVSKSTFNKYSSTWEDMENCCPCILKEYDANDNLIREKVACADCDVGWFKEFYLNGKLKLIGQYKENSTGDWNNIVKRGFCSVRDGQWIYFNKKGDMLYSEFWKDDEFIKQVPEQNTTEIWDVILSLDEQKIGRQTIAINQIGNLRITPKYKNSNTNSTLIVTFEVSASGYKANKKEFTIESFKDIDVASMLSEVEIPENKETTYVLCVYSKGEIIRRFYLNVRR